MAATIARPNRVDREEENAARLKKSREEKVRVWARGAFTYDRPVAKIHVTNVFGDNFRINFYAEVASKEVEAIKVYQIVGSEFVNRKVVESAEDPHDEVIR